MNDELISQIEELGLSNKEARVYVANLMLGPAGVQQIADTSGIKRVTTYVILESLANLGLVSQTNNTKKTLFNAESPDNLRRLLQKREQSLKDQKEQLEELLPLLASLKTVSKDAPSVKFYEGVEGIRTVIKALLDESRKAGIKELLAVSNLDQVYSVFPEIEQADANPIRVQAGIHSRVLYTRQEGAADGGEAKNREARFLPGDKLPINGDMTIVGDKVAIVSFARSNPIGVVIQSTEVVQTFTTLFELAWQSAASYS